MKRNSIIAGVVMSLAGVLALCSCKKEEIKVANVPTVHDAVDILKRTTELQPS